MALTIAEPEKTKGWEDYSKGVAWGTVALAVAVSVGYCLLIAGIANDVVSLPVGMVIATLLIYLVFTVANEAGHGNISHGVSWMKPYERMMGWGVNLLFLILPFDLFAKIHDNHHAFTNDPDREQSLKDQGVPFGKRRHYAFLRAGEPSYACGTLIEKVTVASRRLYLCPMCQAA